MDQLIKATDSVSVAVTRVIPKAPATKDYIGWDVEWTLDKRNVDIDAWMAERANSGLSKMELRKLFEVEVPVDERVIAQGNLLVNGGMDLIWDAVMGTGVTAFSNANAVLGVGDSSTAAAASQTNLQASSNKLRKAMNATYPDQPTNAQIRFQSDFGSSDANFQWLEVATFNNVTDGSGTMLNRLVPSGGLGTKSSGSTWTLTMVITLS